MQNIIIHAENLGRIGIGAGLPTVFLILLYIPLSLYLHFTPFSVFIPASISLHISIFFTTFISLRIAAKENYSNRGSAPNNSPRVPYIFYIKKPPFTERKRKYFFTGKRHVRTTNKPKSVPNIRHFPDTPKFSLFTTFKVLCEVQNT
jgi:hypothetical protein